ncbi:MAG: hypothetical protein JNL08_09830 [Planctomycetes bacterium]|nr:hypothetical protein [Planctomycetota bacterium]
MPPSSLPGIPNDAPTAGRWRRAAVWLPFVLLAAWFVAEVASGTSVVSSPQQLDEQLWIGVDGLEPMYSEPPFRYRVLFRSIVEVVALVLGGPAHASTVGGREFWLAFLLVSAAAWGAALAALRWLLREVGFTGWQLTLGLLAFVSAFPVVHAYGFPTATREDPLGYACLAAGLVFWLRRQVVPFVLVAMAGVATRETLLTLPIVWIVVGPWRGIGVRALQMLPVAATVVGVRLFLSFELYSLANSLDNVLSWKETLLCSLLAFGWMTPPAVRALAARPIAPEHAPLERLHRAWRLVLPVTIATVLVGGIVREMRLLFLVAPWPIVFALLRATLDRSQSACRTAALGGALLLLPVLTLPCWLGEDPPVLTGGALDVYGRTTWLLLLAWHVGAAAWAYWPRRSFAVHRERTIRRRAARRAAAAFDRRLSAPARS